ncbi:uncharacterized protein LOC131314165 isoform X1 [Rhododendron vialii]|uniref:uncharacterized protein LOC131314165 isoform X1 n=2 Tax=Rhododendron vialii TaxID=182163 RepID=UPI00265FFC82|nr:uncharacterized protein LOC131314165 isoform X1 [Rhododendron vialii]XP_058198638.1 uncharacterized protein LOC131314165 isoform X1 [Rhododendron vialii]
MMQLNKEARGLSGGMINQEPTSVISKDGALAEKKINRNIAVQDDEDFSREFPPDRLTPRKVSDMTDMPQNHEKRVGSNKNPNSHLGYEEITKILGLQRMDSDCCSDMPEFASAKGSIAEVENGAYLNQPNGYQKENNGSGHGPTRGTGEITYDTAVVSPSAQLINGFESTQFSQPYGLGFLDGSQSGKMKVLCSFGGKILPRPSDGKLRYVGGETRIVSIRYSDLWEELVGKTLGICKQPHIIKYQLPGEDLDSLISVSSNEDLQNMMEEYQGLEKLGGSQRLRMFLIPLSESENSFALDTNGIQKSNPDYEYVVAVNGIVGPNQWRSSEQVLENGTSRLKTSLEDKESIGDTNSTKNVYESQNPVRSPIQSDPFSLVQGLQGDSKSGYTQIYPDNLLSGSTESNSSFRTAQLPHENSSIDEATYYYPMHGAEILVNHHLPDKIDNTRQPSKPGGVHFQNRIPGREFFLPPSLDQNSSTVDEYSCERPMLKERAFHSEKFEDPTGLLSGSGDSVGSQLVMPHAFSDSKLQEYGRRSSYCSQEGMSPSPPLSFTKPQLSPLVSAALQEPLRPENIDPVNPQFQLKLLDVEPTVSRKGIELPNCSIGLEPLSRNDYSRADVGDNDEKYRPMKDVKSKMFQNHVDDNRLSWEMLNKFDEKDPFLHGDGKLSKSRPPAISILNSNTPRQELQVSGGMISESSGIDLKPFADKVMERPQNIQQEKAPDDLMAEGQRIAKDQHHVSTAVTDGEVGIGIPWPNNLEVSGLFPVYQQPMDENSLADLLYGLKDSLVSHESSNPYPSAAFDNASMGENSHIFHTKQNTIQKPGFRREVSLIDDDFVNYPDQTVAKSDILGCPEDKEMPEKISPNVCYEQNMLDPMIFVEQAADSLFPGMDTFSATVPHAVDATGGAILSSNVAEHESILEESDPESDKGGDGDKGESITDAVIAEFEADIYGLQIIKNADLEELRELGSGTYGTVYHGKWRGSDVAIKRIRSSCFSGRSSEQERLTRDFWREARILSNLHHPNVVAFYGVVPDAAGGTLATVTEFMANGSLRNVLVKKDRSLDRRRKLIVAMDAAFGMEYLHLKNIVHFDLKCDNLLVNLRDPQRPICKVGDFGLSRIKRNTLVSGGVRGTLPWMAPELLNGSSSRVSEKVDVFSFGITLWEILTGEEPYANMHCGAIIGGILKNTLRPPIPERCDPEWRKLIEECWSTDAEARPSFTEITNRLRSMSMAAQGKGQSNQAR